VRASSFITQAGEIFIKLSGRKIKKRKARLKKFNLLNKRHVRELNFFVAALTSRYFRALVA